MERLTWEGVIKKRVREETYDTKWRQLNQPINPFQLSWSERDGLVRISEMMYAFVNSYHRYLGADYYGDDPMVTGVLRVRNKIRIIVRRLMEYNTALDRAYSTPKAEEMSKFARKKFPEMWDDLEKLGLKYEYEHYTKNKGNVSVGEWREVENRGRDPKTSSALQDTRDQVSEIERQTKFKNVMTPSSEECQQNLSKLITDFNHLTINDKLHNDDYRTGIRYYMEKMNIQRGEDELRPTLSVFGMRDMGTSVPEVVACIALRKLPLSNTKDVYGPLNDKGVKTTGEDDTLEDPGDLDLGALDRMSQSAISNKEMDEWFREYGRNSGWRPDDESRWEEKLKPALTTSKGWYIVRYHKWSKQNNEDILINTLAVSKGKDSNRKAYVKLGYTISFPRMLEERDKAKLWDLLDWREYI